LIVYLGLSIEALLVSERAKTARPNEQNRQMIDHLICIIE